MSKMRKALLVMLVLALVKRPLGVLVAAVLPDISVEAAPQLLAAAATALLLLGVPALLLRPWTSLRLVRSAKRWLCLALAACVPLLTRAAMAPVDAAWQRAFGLTAEAVPMPENAVTAALYVLSLAVVPAVTEEVFFRGSLLTGLLDGSRRATAAVLTTAFFALMHGSIEGLPSLLVISLMLTLLMLHSGQIWVPVTAHFFYNIYALVRMQIPLWGSVLSGALLMVLTVYIIFRQPRMAHLPMKRLDGLIAAAALTALAATYFV